MLQKLLYEVESELKKLSHREISLPQKKPFRLGLTVPNIRARLKKGYSFSSLDASEQLKVWNFIWKKSVIYEAMSQALYFYQKKSLSKEEFETVQTWTHRCSCWEHSDDLSKIYAQVVEENPQWVLPCLKKWNKSSLSWERRQSVVSFLEYSKKRKKFLPFQKMIPFVNNLIADEDYYVQKGVGWTLREIYNVYPKEVIEYLKENLTQISPIAYSAAVEKIDKEMKIKFTAQRRVARKMQLL